MCALHVCVREKEKQGGKEGGREGGGASIEFKEGEAEEEGCVCHKGGGGVCVSGGGGYLGAANRPLGVVMEAPGGRVRVGNAIVVDEIAVGACARAAGVRVPVGGVQRLPMEVLL